MAWYTDNISVILHMQSLVKAGKKWFWRYCNFMIFKVTDVCHLGFSNFQMLITHQVGRATVYCLTKIHQNQSTAADISHLYLSLFQNVAIRIFDFFFKLIF